MQCKKISNTTVENNLRKQFQPQLHVHPYRTISSDFTFLTHDHIRSGSTETHKTLSVHTNAINCIDNMANTLNIYSIIKDFTISIVNTFTIHMMAALVNTFTITHATHVFTYCITVHHNTVIPSTFLCRFQTSSYPCFRLSPSVRM